MVGRDTYRIRYGILRPLLSAMGLGPAFSGATVDHSELTVRMGWGFTAAIPREHITDAALRHAAVTSIGVHGWRGRWLVNGASSGLVSVTIDPPVRARVIGVPVNLRLLTVSMDQPEEFLRALGY